MTDMAMCQTECPVSRECFRHPDSGTQSDEYQSWAAFKPDSPCGCDSYIPKKWTPRARKGGLSA